MATATIKRLEFGPVPLSVKALLTFELWRFTS
jgi:hypothetical protein